MPKMFDIKKTLALSDYRELAELRYPVQRFLHFSEQAAQQMGLEPQQHQLWVKGLPWEYAQRFVAPGGARCCAITSDGTSGRPQGCAARGRLSWKTRHHGGAVAPVRGGARARAGLGEEVPLRLLAVRSRGPVVVSGPVSHFESSALGPSRKSVGAETPLTNRRSC